MNLKPVYCAFWPVFYLLLSTGLNRNQVTVGGISGGILCSVYWLHVLSQKNMTITWGYYFCTGIVMTLPVLFVTLAALALRLSFTL
ncbi:ArsB/NhaD family transporter [Citrobacter werkmanii]|uniref:ArsB/NhaD family transporter n=1 Tax=Citrobacter werkmanii TaxID=67827 RepID=UPI0037CC5213